MKHLTNASDIRQALGNPSKFGKPHESQSINSSNHMYFRGAVLQLGSTRGELYSYEYVLTRVALLLLYRTQNTIMPRESGFNTVEEILSVMSFSLMLPNLFLYNAFRLMNGSPHRSVQESPSQYRSGRSSFFNWLLYSKTI